MKKLRSTLIALLICGLAAPAMAQPTPGERDAMARKQASAEAEARQEIESLFSRLCPGRCELIEVKAVVGQPKVVGEITPGFDLEGSAAFDVELKRLEARVMIDSTLPRNFMSNLPAMLQYRLSSITPNVVISPTVLEFPSPQLAPMPPMMPEPPRRSVAPEPVAPQPPVEEVKPEEVKPEEQVKPEPVVEQPWYKELWATMLPWIPFILMLLVFFGLMMFALRRIKEMTQPAGAQAGQDPALAMPDIDALRQELRQSRVVQNEVLRAWIQEDPSAVATLIRLIGPEALSDLKQDPALKPAVATVSAEIARQSEPVSPREAQRVAREAHARITAARVLQEDGAMGAEWEFAQGLGSASVQRVMAPLSPRERSFALGQLPPALRASYMEQLPAEQRRALFLDAGSAEPLSKEEAHDLSARMRKAADDVAHIGREAGGQATLVVDMLRALPLSEQLDTLRELVARRPEVAQAVLDQVCLESTVLLTPPEVLADAMQRTPIDILSAFLRGTQEGVRQHLVASAPGNLRGPLRTELELELPVGRADFLAARAEFTSLVAVVLRRDGHDLASLNRQVVQGAHAPTQPAT